MVVSLPDQAAFWRLQVCKRGNRCPFVRFGRCHFWHPEHDCVQKSAEPAETASAVSTAGTTSTPHASAERTAHLDKVFSQLGSLMFTLQDFWNEALAAGIDGQDQVAGCGERMRKPILDQWMISQTWPYDWACKGRSAEMAAWRHLVLEEGHDDRPGMGRATALLDMTKCFEQVRLWHVWRWGCHWGFPRALLRIILLVFSFQRRAVRDDLRSHHRRLGFLVCHPPHALHMAL